MAPESAIAYSRGGEAREWGDSAVGKMRRERASMLLAALLLMARGRVWNPGGPPGRFRADEVWDCRLEGTSNGSCLQRRLSRLPRCCLLGVQAVQGCACHPQRLLAELQGWGACKGRLNTCMARACMGKAAARWTGEMVVGWYLSLLQVGQAVAAAEHVW